MCPPERMGSACTGVDIWMGLQDEYDVFKAGEKSGTVEVGHPLVSHVSYQANYTVRNSLC